MNNAPRVYIILFIALFAQCKTNQLGQMQNEINKSTSIKFINKQEFDKSRELMLKTFSSEILENDSIIIIERFTDINGNYHCSIYESKYRANKQYNSVRNIRKGRVYVDSLTISKNPIKDKILKMVREGKLDEIKSRGDASTITPAPILIINIITRNKEKYSLTTLVTQGF